MVCSPHDLAGIRAVLPRYFLTVVPGIRPADSAAQDQKRIATPKTAVEAGADILVIGRAITGAARSRSGGAGDPGEPCMTPRQNLRPLDPANTGLRP